MNRRSFLRALGSGGSVAVVAGFAGCTGNDDSPNDTEPVGGRLAEMTDSNTFDPETVTVPAGETIVWRNVGAAPHTVTAYENEIPLETAYFASGDFESEQAARNGYTEGKGIVQGNEGYEHAFDVPGRYEYFCIPHESMGMTGTVVVTDSSESENPDGDVAALGQPAFDRAARAPRGVR